MELRKISILTLLALAFTVSGYSQCLNCNTKGIKTDPGNSFNNSVNTEKPSKRNTFFNWTNLGLYPVNSQYWPSPYNNIESPFNQDGNLPLSFLLENPDRLPQDGWELVKYDLGFNEDGTPKGTPTRNIYIILYNRYTGVLRVFVAANEVVAFNGIEVTMTFLEGKQTNLLSNASKIFALDKFEPSPFVKGIAQYIPSKWMYTDFSMTYDPCTCFNPSKIGISIKYLNNSTISLSGSINGSITTVQNNTMSVTEDGYSITDLVGAGKEAKKAYDNIAKFTNDQFKALGIEGKNDFQLTTEQLFKKHSLNSFQEGIKKSSFLKAGLKAAPYISAAVELVDFFIGGGKKAASSIQEVKVMPMALQANVRLSGSLNADYPFPGITFYTPGSKDASCGVDSQYPYYNEVLGVFNLLETPKFYESILESYHFYDQGTGYYEDREHRRYQMTPIKYVINPASGLRVDNAEIMASIDFGSYKTAYLPISAINSFSFDVGEFSYDYGGGNSNYGLLGCLATGYPIAIRLLINLTRNDATSDTQNVLIASTYPIAPSTTNLSEFNPSYCSYSNSITLSNQFVLSNILAWDNISIGSNVSFGNNPIIKSQSVAMQAGSVITTGVVLQSGLPNGHVPYQVLPVAQSEIQSFCGGASYNSQNRLLRKSDVENENLEKEIEFEDENFAVYPNPASDNITLRYLIQLESQVNISIHDVYGSLVTTTVNEFQSTGVHDHKFDLVGLSSGMYLITLETNQGTQTKKLIVTK